MSKRSKLMHNQKKTHESKKRRHQQHNEMNLPLCHNEMGFYVRPLAVHIKRLMCETVGLGHRKGSMRQLPGGMPTLLSIQHFHSNSLTRKSRRPITQLSHSRSLIISHSAHKLRRSSPGHNNRTTDHPQQTQRCRAQAGYPCWKHCCCAHHAGPSAVPGAAPSAYLHQFSVTGPLTQYKYSVSHELVQGCIRSSVWSHPAQTRSRERCTFYPDQLARVCVCDVAC